MPRRIPLLAAAIAALLPAGAPPSLRAGGPLKPDASAPIRWKTDAPIPYRIDRGDLGAISAGHIQALVQRAFRTWADVPTATIRFRFDGLLDDDIATLADYYLATGNETGGDVVILDEDGDILAEIYGESNRGRITGFAEPVVVDHAIAAFYALFNGRLAKDPDTFLPTIVHEFGHAIGLDHTQIHADLAIDGDPANDRYVPTMYPTTTDDYKQLATLRPDDRAWVSLLYPSPCFRAGYGTIRGRLVRGKPASALKGANVVAIGLGAAEISRMERFSCVSDWLKRDSGSFLIPVPPGAYRLRIEPIDPRFSGGSHVGPYADSPYGPSFINPVKPQDGPAEVIVRAGAQTDVGTLSVD